MVYSIVLFFLFLLFFSPYYLHCAISKWCHFKQAQLYLRSYIEKYLQYDQNFIYLYFFCLIFSSWYKEIYGCCFCSNCIQFIFTEMLVYLKLYCSICSMLKGYTSSSLILLCDMFYTHCQTIVPHMIFSWTSSKEIHKKKREF